MNGRRDAGARSTIIIQAKDTVSAAAPALTRPAIAFRSPKGAAVATKASASPGTTR